ncbi:acyl-CoA dehydrogenase family protein [Psychrobacillus sp. OK032]|uniref:acyl-CoA dehydrogenase family protein n=1 Tax=Psychrobacillus sp. OK032 TaxID=1884358 RepID=UPI0008B869B9|nr:acyl-CoA dehydrogenase family protein [Psychrobacillus sp. OK032]SER69695.1 acyl-CoA dehydrogenase [Psychrobacillus sp. OK032]
MSEMKSFIEETTEKMLKDLSTKELRERFEKGEWIKSLWDAIQESGLTLLGINEDQGGVGGDFEDIFAILRITGKYAAPVPLAEVLYANHFLANQEGEVKDKLRVVQFEDGSGKELKSVPYARYVEEVIVISDAGYKVVNLSRTEIVHKENLAAEPRDTVRMSFQTEIKSMDSSYEEVLEDYTNYLALSRVAMMTGAMESVLALSIFYSKERQQFGRALHKFQAIQHHLTAMAGETAAAYATLAATSAAYKTEAAKEQIAMAKIEVSTNVNVVAKAAHQLHAGIGMTYEHELHHFTRRLWAWREEGGNETYWSDQLAKIYVTRKESIWEWITNVKGAQAHAGSTI